MSNFDILDTSVWDILQQSGLELEEILDTDVSNKEAMCLTTTQYPAQNENAHLTSLAGAADVGASLQLEPTKITTKTDERRPTFLTVTEEEKSQFVIDMRNKNTMRKTNSVMNQFKSWLQQGPRFENREINTIEPYELDNYIGSFLLSIRKADGFQYEPDTLTSYHRGIDRYLREKGYPYSLVTAREFLTSRTILSSKRKELKQKGKGNRPNAAEPLTKDEEDVLREKECIGLKDPNQLLIKMWLNNTMLFGLRGGSENHKLRWGDILLKQDERENEYLEFNERATKTRTGETSGTHQRTFRPKQFAHEDKENCPVEAYKLYRDQRPATMSHPDAPFYLAINHNRTLPSHKWFKAQPLGENTLRSIMKVMATKANLPGKKTNHSARKTTCTKLLHAGIAPSTIQQLTGHKNIQSVNNYATASNEMQKNRSNILSGGSDECALSLLPDSRPSVQKRMQQTQSVNSHSSMNTTSSNEYTREILHNAKLMNCNITINNNYAKSPVPKRRRIRILDSDSD